MLRQKGTLISRLCLSIAHSARERLALTWKLSSAPPTNDFFVRCARVRSCSFRHRKLLCVSGSQHDVGGFTIRFWLKKYRKNLNLPSLTTSTSDSSPCMPLSSCMMFRAAADADGLMFPSGPGARRRRRHLGWPKEGREEGASKVNSEQQLGEFNFLFQRTRL